MAGGGSTFVERLSQHPKVKGSSLVEVPGSRRHKIAKITKCHHSDGGCKVA
jgi:hypothetical protein